MLRRIDKGSLTVAFCVAGALMSGMLLAVWQRALDTVAGRTAHSLMAGTAAVGAGLVLGFVVAGWLCRKVKEPAAVLRFTFLALGCWLAVQLAAVSGVAAGWQRILNDLSRTFAQYGVTLLKTAAVYLLLPAVLSGVAARAALHSQLRSLPRQQGQAVTLVLLQAVLPASLGYVLAASVLVPVAGAEGMTRLAALWFGVLSSLVLARSAWSALPFLTVAGVLAAVYPHVTVSAMTDGVFGRLMHRDSGFARGTPAYAFHSRHHTAVVYDDKDYTFVFALDGRPLLFGSRFHTARTLTGYLPLLLNPGCRRAAVFGPEAGFYVPYLVRGGVPEVSYAGADSEIVRRALLSEGNISGDDVTIRGVVRPGARLRPREAYDLVVLAAEPVWMRGTGRAYSRSLFRRCRSALSEGGLVALHMDARALSKKRFAAIARAFADVFPDLHVWNTGLYDWVLIGGAKPVEVSAERMLEMFEQGPVVRDFARAGVLSLPEVLACMVCDGGGLAPWLERADSEAEWQTLWRAPKAVFGDGEELLQPVSLEECRQRKTGWLTPGKMEEDVYLAIRSKAEQYKMARTAAATALSENARGHSDAALAAARSAAKVNPRDVLLLQLADALELEGRRRIAIGEYKGALKCYENLLSFAPGAARGHYGLGFCLRAGGENENAYLHFARAVAIAPEQTGYRMELAQVAVTVGEYAEADRQFREVLKREPEHAEALFRYAKALAVKERPGRDMAQAIKLAERACVLTAWKNSEFAFGLADLYLDAGRVMEGVGLKRRLKEIGKGQPRAAGK